MEKNEYRDILFEIADAVSMQDVLTHYGFPVRRARGRIPCPFHSGKDNNLGYSEHKFSCFVCGIGGNPVSFVARLFDESNSKAAQRIDQDFGLNLLGRELSFAERRQLERKRQDRIDKIKEESKRTKSYLDACELIHKLEAAIKGHMSELSNGEEYDIDDYLATLVHLKSNTERRLDELWEALERGYRS